VREIPGLSIFAKDCVPFLPCVFSQQRFRILGPFPFHLTASSTPTPPFRSCRPPFSTSSVRKKLSLRQCYSTLRKGSKRSWFLHLLIGGFGCFFPRGFNPPPSPLLSALLIEEMLFLLGSSLTIGRPSTPVNKSFLDSPILPSKKKTFSLNVSPFASIIPPSYQKNSF